jgi:hypothetical protein
MVKLEMTSCWDWVVLAVIVKAREQSNKNLGLTDGAYLALLLSVGGGPSILDAGLNEGRAWIWVSAESAGVVADALQEVGR